MKRILADCHHGDLYESLCILFEDRLGWELYRPLGLEWYLEDYWFVYPALDTAKQYLEVSTTPPKDIHGRSVVDMHGQHAWINKNMTAFDDGIALIHVHNHGGRYQRAIKLERAKKLDFDIVISSLPDHFYRYEKFRQLYCPRAKHIFQLGNVGWGAPPGTKNLLNSTASAPPAGVHSVTYHQEFSLKEFCYKPCPNPRTVTNLMHYQDSKYKRWFDGLRLDLGPKGWSFKDYGSGNEDGPIDDIAKTIQDSGWIWHLKTVGDGYGHNIHNTFASGRPMITNSRDYAGKMAYPLFIDGQTILDFNSHDLAQIGQLLEANVSSHDQWCKRALNRFNEIVDFDREFKQIQWFLANLAD